MTTSRGFKSWARDTQQYGLGDMKTRRRGLNNSFFVGSAVKSIDSVSHDCVDANPTESAALWGQDGKFQEVKL